MELLIKNGSDLTKWEFIQIDQSLSREFGSTMSNDGSLVDIIFFLLEKGAKILAMGQLVPVTPVFSNGEKFALLGIGGIVANGKGKGFGKQVVTTIQAYLADHDKTGVGFCLPTTRNFYEKCGLGVDATAAERFIYQNSNEIIRKQDGQHVIYQDASDHFMEKVLANPMMEVFIPREPTW